MDTGASSSVGDYYFNVGGQMQFNHSGDSGFIRFTLSEASGGGLWSGGTGYTKFNPHVVGNIGGLSGRGVFSATKWLSTTVDINFVSNSEGVFQGGVWTGAFTRSSTEDYSPDSSEQWQREVYQNSIGSTASVAFVMDSGNRSVKQTVNLQSAKTFFGDSTSETDIESFTVEVRSGNLEFNSELAIDKVTLAGDNALLKFTSAQKVGEFVIDAGALAFGGTITAGDFHCRRRFGRYNFHCGRPGGARDSRGGIRLPFPRFRPQRSLYRLRRERQRDRGRIFAHWRNGRVRQPDIYGSGAGGVCGGIGGARALYCCKAQKIAAHQRAQEIRV